MKNNKVGIAIIGTGFAANFHAENYKKVHGVDVNLVGVYGRRPDVTRAFIKKHGFQKHYPVIKDLMKDPDVDIVDACIPNRFHEKYATRVLRAQKHVVVEKPFTGAFTPGTDEKSWKSCRESALASADRMLQEESKSKGKILYAENWIYAPGVSKAVRLLASANSPILRMVGEEAHSGTHSKYSMKWETSGGGSLLNKGCHLLGAMLHLKYSEGMRRYGHRIRPTWVVAVVGNLTFSKAFNSEESNVIRTGWTTNEDWGTMIVGFEDGSVAEITGSDVTVGGIRNVLSIYTTKTSIQININPNDSVLAYSTDNETFANEYIREKVETTSGWQYTNPDEDWMNGFPHEFQNFCEVVAMGKEPIAGSIIGRDVVAVSYSAYLSAHSGKRVEIPMQLDKPSGSH